MMAQFTVQGSSLKPLIKRTRGGGGAAKPFPPPSSSSSSPFRLQKRKLVGFFHGSNRGVFASSSPLPRRRNSSSSSAGGSESYDLVVGGGVYGGDDYDEDSDRDELSCFRGLVLDISYRPVNVVCWKRAICLEFMEKADVLEYYDQTVNSANGSYYIPAVLRVPHLLQVVKRRRIRKTLSRKNIFFRDNFTCQYCLTRENLTIDHVLPIARGGKWTWENLVTACSKCNSRKGPKTVEEANMKLHKVPKAPNDYDILAIPLTNGAIKMLGMRKGTPEEWRQYLSNSSSSAAP